MRTNIRRGRRGLLGRRLELAVTCSVTISATNATLNGKQVRTGDCAVAVIFVGAHKMRVEIRASCRTANGAKLGAIIVTIIAFIVSAAAAIIFAAHYYCCVVVVVVVEESESCKSGALVNVR